MRAAFLQHHQHCSHHLALAFCPASAGVSRSSPVLQVVSTHLVRAFVRPGTGDSIASSIRRRIATRASGDTAPATSKVVTAGGASGSTEESSAADDTMPARKASAHKPAPLHLEGVNNIRDFAEALPGVIAPGRMLRCASPAAATEADMKVLLDDIGVKELIDLRSAEELAEDADASVLFKRAGRLLRYPRVGWVLPAVDLHPEEAHPGPQGGLLHHQVSLLERSRYYTTLLMHLPWRTSAWALGLALTGWKEASRASLIKVINTQGLGLLYRMLVDSARPEIVAGLRLITRALEHDRPVLLFCKAGKDRTGLMSALVLSVAGADREVIVADYHRSDSFHKVALAGIENKEELRGLDRSVFERAPREAMEELLDYIERYHGSVAEYLARCGFGADEQDKLRHLLTSPRPHVTSPRKTYGRTSKH